ncbi:MAG TPA: DNA polymerase IV [Marinagarivorans sp.]
MRKVIHIDADCFFAAVEMRDAPHLREKPIAVGGRSSGRGVISTCNYPARRFGVHSAMPTSHALRLCPDLVLCPHRFEVYRSASQVMRSIFHDYTDLVEPLSLDEAFLDVTSADSCSGSATRIAEQIRLRVEREVGITCSAGVANNKFLAKVASDWRKPDGITVITPDQNDAFSKALPVVKLSGVGRVTAGKLAALGLHTCADVRAYGLEPLVKRFGKFGLRLFERSYGRDNRPVVASRERHSIGVEHTFDHDLAGEECLARLADLLVELECRIAKAQAVARVAKLFVKVKFSDFVSTTVERRCHSVEPSGYADLLCQALTRSPRKVRLLGVGVKVNGGMAGVQLALF